MIAFRMARRKSVVWVIYTGVVTALDLAKLREAGAVFIHAEGDCDVIHDFSAATKIDIPLDVMGAQGAAPPHAPGRLRPMVTPPGQVRETMLFYRDGQVRHGYKPPDFVDTVDEALRMVDCRREEFTEIDTRFLDEVEVSPNGTPIKPA